MLSQVERSVYIRAPRGLVYGALKSYEQYQRWVPDITESKTFGSEGEISVVEFRSPAFGDGKLVLEFIESPESEILFRQVDRYRTGGLSGRFGLEEADDGTGVVVRAAMSARSGLLGVVYRRRVRAVLDRMLAALRSRAQQMAAASPTGEAGQRIEILELSREGDSLLVGLHGEVFTLASRGGGPPE